MYLNSYAKACRFILEEKFNEALKVLRQNESTWKNIVPEAEKIGLYLNTITPIFEKIANIIMNSIHARNIGIIGELIFEDKYISFFYKNICREILSIEEKGILNLNNIIGNYGIDMNGIYNLIKLVKNKYGLDIIIARNDRIIYGEYLDKIILNRVLKAFQ